MIGIKLLVGGIFSFFRIPYNSLLMDSYLFPPKTTIVGMIGAALGWNEEKVLSIMDSFKYGVIIRNPGERVIETARIFKSKDSPVYPINKIMNYKPLYEIFVASENIDMMDKIGDTLNDPKYPLYLGESECLFYPKNPEFCEKIEIEEGYGDEFECILPSEIFNKKKEINMISKEIVPPTETKIPIGFTEKGIKRKCVLKNVFYYSGIKVKLENPIKTYKYGKQSIYLF